MQISERLSQGVAILQLKLRKENTSNHMTEQKQVILIFYLTKQIQIYSQPLKNDPVKQI